MPLHGARLADDGRGRSLAAEPLCDARCAGHRLCRFCGITDAYRAGEDTGYADVSSDDPDAPFIRWASDAGLMIGTGGQFSSDATLTREQLATVLARYLTLQGEAEAPRTVAC